MAAHKRVAVEEFLADSERFLWSMGNLEDLLRESAEGVEPTQTLHRSPPTELLDGLNPGIDGYAEIRISEDGMEATATFQPASEDKIPLSLDAFTSVLTEKGITHGVLWTNIQEAILTCNSDRLPLQGVLIARGKAPIDEIPKHLRIHSELLRRESDSLPYQGRIDYRNASPFVLVKEGDVLAEWIEGTPGRMGHDVTGKALSFHTKTTPLLKPGKNTNDEGKRIIAACDGRFEKGKNTFWVNPVLEVAGNVDYRTGHIDFPGDVIIWGDIKDGFNVRAGGSILSTATIDATKVSSAADIKAKKGIIGRSGGTVRAGGTIEAKFIQNCTVSARGSVIVETGIMNSHVCTLDAVQLGGKGVILGGKVCAQNGITAQKIGSPMGVRTDIVCGINHEVQQKLEWIREKTTQLAFRIKQVEGKLKSNSASLERQQHLVDLKTRLKEAMHKLNEAAGMLLFKLDGDEQAEVVVRGRVYPGVYIEICHLPFVVREQMGPIRFRLDKDKGKIVTAAVQEP